MCVRFSGYYSSIAQSVERMTVNHDVVGSSPTWGAIFFHIYGSMVKRLRHRPFTAVTRVRFPLESLKWRDSQVVRPRSATPSSPVQIRLTPLRSKQCFDLFLFFMQNLIISWYIGLFLMRKSIFMIQLF